MPLPAAELYSFGAEVNAFSMTELCGQPACSVLYLCYFHSQPWGQSCASLMTVFAVSHGLKFTDPDTRPTILHNTFCATFFLNLVAYYNFLFQSTKYYFHQIQLWNVFFFLIFFSPIEFINLRADSQILFWRELVNTIVRRSRICLSPWIQSLLSRHTH